MYCKKCGKELEDTAKFCDGCGQPQQDLPAPQGPVAVYSAVSDAKLVLKTFFSKNAPGAIAQAAGSQTTMGIVLIVINALLFALVSCVNITQAINHAIKAATSAIASTTNSLLGGAMGNALAGQAIPDMRIPVLFDFFFPFFLFALGVAAALFGAIFLQFKLKKQSFKSIYTVFNVIGVSGLPITGVLGANLILGLILPQFTVFVLLAGALVGLALLYESLKTLFETEKAPIFEFSILAAALCMVLAIAWQIVLGQVGTTLQDALMKTAGDGIAGLGGLLGKFLG